MNETMKCSVMCCGSEGATHITKHIHTSTTTNIHPLNSINYFLCLCSRLPKQTKNSIKANKTLTHKKNIYNTHTHITLHILYYIYMHYPQQQCNIKELYRHIKMICMKINCVQFIFIVHHLTSSFIFIFRYAIYHQYHNIYTAYNMYIISMSVLEL